MFSKIRQEISVRFKEKRIQQVVLLYSVNVISIPVGIVSSIIVTRFLGAEVYGDYKFLTSVFSLAVVLFTFGFFQAGNRALVLNNDITKAKEIYGTELVIVAMLFLIMAFCLTVFGQIDPNLKAKGLNNFFILLIPFSWVFLLLQYFEDLFQADNQIKLLAATRLWPKIGFLIIVLILLYFYSDYQGDRHSVIWLFFLSIQAIVFITVLMKIKPSFHNIKSRIAEIWKFNLTYGSHVFIGSLFSVGLGHLSGVLISYYGIDNTGVGYYTLALTFAAPLALIPNVIATTHYKDFSTQKQISARLIKVTLLFSLAGLIVLWIIVGPFIRIFYGPDFEPVIMLNLIVSTGVMFHGLADFFNRFLGAHGKGKALRNSSFIIGATLLILNLILIPKFGETGAAITKIASGGIYFMLMIFYYKNLRSELKNQYK